MRYTYILIRLIRVVGTDKKAVGVLKLKVEKIARGEVVEVWDRFSSTGRARRFSPTPI